MKKCSFFIFLFLISCAEYTPNYSTYYIDAVVVPYFENGLNPICPVNGYTYIQIFQFLIIPLKVEKLSEFRGFVQSEYSEPRTKIYIDFYNAIRITDMNGNPVSSFFDTNTTMLLNYYFNLENFFDLWDEVGSVSYKSNYYPVYSTSGGFCFYTGQDKDAWMRLDTHLYGFHNITNGVQLKVCNTPDQNKISDLEMGLLAEMNIQLSNLMKNIYLSTYSNSQNFIQLSNSVTLISNSIYKIESFFENSFNYSFGIRVFPRNELGSGIQSISFNETNWWEITEFWMTYHALTEISNTSPPVFKFSYYIKKYPSSAFVNPLFPSITNSCGMVEIATYMEQEFFSIEP